MSDGFIRARRPAHKSQRQAQLLAAARRIIEQHGVDAVTMAGMAKEAEIAQSAFYRYFKSKEEILAHLLIEEAKDMTGSLREHLTGCVNMPEIAVRFASILAARTLFCTLASDLARTLERNIAFDRLVVIKQAFAGVLQDWTTVLIDSGGVESRATAVQFIRGAYVILAGLWPITQDRPIVVEAAQAAGLNETFKDFETEFRVLLTNLARGVEAG